MWCCTGRTRFRCALEARGCQRPAPTTDRVRRSSVRPRRDPHHDGLDNTIWHTSPAITHLPSLTRHEGVEGINDGLSDLGVLFVLTAADTDRANGLAV
jgi:hypothetical protein